MDKVEVTVFSGVNYDGYKVDNEYFICNEADKVRAEIGEREIIWKKGKNSFTGKPVGDTFFEIMKKAIEEVDNG